MTRRTFSLLSMAFVGAATLFASPEAAEAQDYYPRSRDRQSVRVRVGPVSFSFGRRSRTPQKVYYAPPQRAYQPPPPRRVPLQTQAVPIATHTQKYLIPADVFQDCLEELHYETSAQEQLKIIEGMTRKFLFTADQIVTMTETICGSRNRVNALLCFYPSWQHRCDYEEFLAETDHLVSRRYRHQLKQRLAALDAQLN